MYRVVSPAKHNMKSSSPIVSTILDSLAAGHYKHGFDARVTSHPCDSFRNSPVTGSSVGPDTFAFGRASDIDIMISFSII